MDGGPTFGWTMTDVGDGQIDLETFVSVAPKKGYHHYLIERDTAPGGASDPGQSFRTHDAAPTTCWRCEADPFDRHASTYIAPPVDSNTRPNRSIAPLTRA
jgi:hypothetical protein